MSEKTIIYKAQLSLHGGRKKQENLWYDSFLSY